MMMADLQELIDEYAEGSNYTEQAEKFSNLDRWTGKDPILMLADAAGTTTGQNYFDQVKPSVEDFRDQFLNPERIGSMEELARLDLTENDLIEIFEGERKRRVLIEGAKVIADFPGDNDLDRLQNWAQSADPMNYSEDPFGQISGVGLRTFQYLRMVAGVDTVKPDIQVKKFIKELSDATGYSKLDSSTDHSVLKSCKWISAETDYRMIELDQIAWWYFSEAGKRHG